jgi:hypothetical protein
MVEPVRFIGNLDTAADNFFQHTTKLSHSKSQELALAEFQSLVAALKSAGITVQVFKDNPELQTPDSIFPNNWFTTHSDGTLVLYPMKSISRRPERRADIISELKNHFPSVWDLSVQERFKCFLEGTGSLILDRIHKRAYACISPRTDPKLVNLWCNKLGFEPMLFHAVDAKGRPIYHTNVMFSLGTNTAVVCLEAISDVGERTRIETALQESGKRVISINLAQVDSFCGNCLELRSSDNQRCWVMSSTAWDAFTADQQRIFSEDGSVIHVPLRTIETLGGGGARCMIAELFVDQ